MRVRSQWTAICGAVAATVALTTAPAAAHVEHHHSAERKVSPRLLAEARAATAAFHNPEKALAAGFIPTEHCVPGMGQHWINPTNLADGVHDPAKPDVLLYEPTPNGVRLVGVEWLQWDADQNLDTDRDRPDLGGVPFDGPMLGHEPGMPIHYDLHLYIWKHNPNGIEVNNNPRITC